MAQPRTKKLLVEGKDDLHSIVALMAAHTPWGDTPKEAPVFIKDCDGVDDVLDPVGLSTELKSSESRTLGIVVDANGEFDSRWRRIRDRCSAAFSEIPEELPDGGLILTNAEGRRLGAWIMPDNRSHGMLETFLSYLVPNAAEPVWSHAQYATKKAKDKGATFRDGDLDKANIHTWLAWQKEPGKPFGVALKFKFLDPRSPYASDFVDWFLDLYQLDRSGA